MKDKNKISIILIISLLGFGVGALLHILTDNSLVYWPSAFRYPDYKVTVAILDKIYSGVSTGRGYFPFMYVILNIIKAIFGLNLSGFFVTFVITIGILFYFYITLLKDVKYKIPITICFLIFSYPTIFEFDRANVEYLVLAALVMFFIAYKKEKYDIAALLLALPICMKLYPGVFVILFLKNKKYKEFFLCGIFSVMLMVWSFIMVGGNLDNLPIAIENFSFFTDAFAKKRSWITIQSYYLDIFKCYKFKIWNLIY